MAVIVVYGGGFQPFHVGHLSSYIEAKEAFPDADFYVAASNDTKTRPIPFNDKQFLAQQAGVSDPFVQVKLPINPTEILDRYSPKKDIFILVRSERDPVGYTKKDGTPGYFQPFTSLNKCQSFGHHGYVFVTHKKEFKLNGQVVYSGTQVRDMYASADDKGRQLIVKQLYPESKQQRTIKQMLDQYIGTVAEPIEKPVKGAIKKLKANKLKEQIQRIRPLIREASIEQKYKFLKLMKEAAQLDELNLFGKKSNTSAAKKPINYDEIRRIAAKTGGTQQQVYSSPEEYYAKINTGKTKEPVKEFAPPGGDDNGPDEEAILRQLASQWWRGDADPKAERTLAAMGWEIGQDESGDDDAGVFLVRPGDVNGDSYIAFPQSELELDEGQTSDMRNFFSTQQPRNPAPIQPGNTGPTIARVTRQGEGVAEGLSEARNSLFAFVKQQFPTWPDYVLKDFLYAQAKGIRDQAELDDFLKRNKQDFGNCKWTLTKLPITFDIFTPKTQRMLASREGGSSNPFQVPKDAERHAQQSQMIQQKGVSTEPIIVAKLSNGYDLIEGWHRTIQHLKAFPQGYTGPAWVCTGATYKRESVEQGVAEGGLEANTPNPVVVIQDKNGKILDKVNLSVAAKKYNLGQPDNVKKQLAHQNYTTIGNYVVVSPMSGQPQDNTTQGVLEDYLPEK